MKHAATLLERAQRAGTFDPSRRPRLNVVRQAFSVVAYLNLTPVFAVLFLLAIRRWGR
jgi:hypothetical protein